MRRETAARIAEVGREGGGLHAEAERGDLGDNRGKFFLVATVDDHVGAGAGEGDGHRLAEALGGAGDEGDFATEAEFLLEIRRHAKRFRFGPRGVNPRQISVV